MTMTSALEWLGFLASVGLLGWSVKWIEWAGWPAWKYRRALAWGHGRTWPRHFDQARRYDELEKHRLSCSQRIRSMSGICRQPRWEQIAITEISEDEGRHSPMQSIDDASR